MEIEDRAATTGFMERRLVVNRSKLPGLNWLRRRLTTRSVLWLALLLGLEIVGPSTYPQFPSTRSQRSDQHYPDATGQQGEESNSPEQKRIKLLNAERQRSLVSDAEKLLKLAKELNSEVNQSDTETLNGEQLHKVEAIAKLAKNVKEKMSYSVGGFPASAPLTIQPGIQ